MVKILWIHVFADAITYKIVNRHYDIGVPINMKQFPPTENLHYDEIVVTTGFFYHANERELLAKKLEKIVKYLRK